MTEKLNAKLSVLLFLFVITAHAQDTTGIVHQVALTFGVNQVKDKNLHDKVSTGTVSGLSYGFEKITDKNQWHQFYFNLGYSRMKTELEDLSKSVNIKLNLSYSKAYQILRKNSLNYYLGPEATLAYNACYLPDWDDSHLYWADYLSIGVKNIFAVNFKNKNEWVSTLSFPLFSVFSRPELYRLYKIDDTELGGIVHNLNSNITAAHLENTFFIHLQTEYRFPVFSKKREAFTYSFDWIRVKHNDGNSFIQIEHRVGIKLFL